MRKLLLATLLVLMALQPILLCAKQKQDPLVSLKKMQNASLLMEKEGKAVISKRSGELMIPASTLKLLTALAAVEQLGIDHRFHTEFFIAKKSQLWVKGYGDPFLVSEELDLIVAALKKKGVKKVSAIVTDTSYFASNLYVDGRSQTDNPYDAPLSALAANFNTVAFKRTKKGAIVIAEKQTPITPLAEKLGKKYLKKRSKARVNLETEKNAERYFAELLAAKLRLGGVEVGAEIRSGKVPDSWKPDYRHENSRPLSEVVEGMLLGSSNFIANSLFLLMSDEGDGKPLDLNHARWHMKDWIDKRFGWKQYSVIEGSGLSRGNRLSADQLVEVVKAFEPYRELLPSSSKGKVKAKTGTLKGVSCYAGFVSRNGTWQPFCLFINQPVAYGFRKQVAEALATQKKLPSICGSNDC